jgi:hypothetical protein
MKPKWGMDLGIPVGVGVADVAIAWWDERRIAQSATAMPFEPIFGPVAAVAGYGMMLGNWYPAVGEVIAHSAVPLAIRSIWAWAKTQTWFPAGMRMQYAQRAAAPVMAQPVQRGVRYGYPAQPDKPEFSAPPAF